ncbi:MAG: hypothetical protein IGS03_05995 [Candidatus Sericytochromatia bacterium]|nr:hypothetical protein [Candidatus Sericytochromatia bacterium]
MRLTAQQRKDYENHLARAERLHNTGDLSGALKAYREALKLADDQQQTAIKGQIDELHDMLTFVSSVDDENAARNSFAPLDWLKDHLQTLLLSGVVVASALLLLLIVPPLLQGGPGSQGSPPPLSEEDLADTYARGDNSAPLTELKGNLDPADRQYVKEADSRMRLSVPAEILEPYPSKYVIEDQAPISETPGGSVLEKLPRNQQVLLIGKTPAANWLRIRLADRRMAWIPARMLADEPYKTPAEIDAEIKASMGGQYWQLLVHGREFPFSYFLRVNAPDAASAHAAVVAGYQAYASRQLLRMINRYSHRQIKTIAVEAASFTGGSPERLDVNLSLYSQTNSRSSRQPLGQQQVTLVRGPNTGRYLMQVPLEGM